MHDLQKIGGRLQIFLPESLSMKTGWQLGALLVLIMGFALAIVPVLMFPIAKRHNEPLALGYVVFRGGLVHDATMTALPAVAHILAGSSLRLLSQRFFRLRVVLEHYQALRGGVDLHVVEELLAECAVHTHAV
jgi:hypothetical protein